MAQRQKKDVALEKVSKEEKIRTQHQYRKNMCFEQSPDGDRAISFLESCGRKQGTLTTYALLEFIEKYGLESKTTKEIVAFANTYKYIQSALAQNNINVAFTAPTMPIMEQIPISSAAVASESHAPKQSQEELEAAKEAAEIEDIKNQMDDLLKLF